MEMNIVKNKDPETYQPIKIELTLDTLEEARLFYAVLNDHWLREHLAVHQPWMKADTFASDLGTGSDVDTISLAITDQGFEIHP